MTDSSHFAIFDVKKSHENSSSRAGIFFQIVNSHVELDGRDYQASKIQFGGYVPDKQVRELINRSSKSDEGEPRGIERALEFIEEVLSDAPMLVSELNLAAKNRGISFSTLGRARKELGVVSWKQSGKGQASKFLCCLPGKGSDLG